MRIAPVLLLLVVATACDEITPPSSSPPEDAHVDVLEVRCDGSTTDVLTPTVQAQPDGVHVRIDNTSDAAVLTQWAYGGDDADPGISEQLLPIMPGAAKFRCQEDTPDVDPGAPGGWATYVVVAPTGWVSPELECEHGSWVGNLDPATGATGVADPSASARRKADTDDVQQAGYATDEEVTFVAFDEGGTPAQRFEFTSDGVGGWLLSEASHCS